ncbi:MAG: monovalent cation/H(+) antiporter subunit G [Anaerolineae bacterium]|jgi:multicomponent Na+:H+ antiporter subunit G|nr:monovalent cation/H(+) antiporter subunit G [Anaerolineae bacterium]
MNIDFSLREAVTLFLMAVGVLFMLVAAVGVLRMPDLYLRMSASTKAATMGVGFIMLAVMVRFNQLAMTTRALAIIVFVYLTAPVAAHMIGRAGYILGVSLYPKTALDELRGHYITRRGTHELESVSLKDSE